MNNNGFNRFAQWLGRLSLPVLYAVLAANAHAQDLDLSNCAGGTSHTFTFEVGDTVTPQNIFAILPPPPPPPDPPPSAIFWELASASPDCTPSPDASFPVSYSCTNGLNMALPAGATAATPVSAALPTTVTASPVSSAGSTSFTLTATLDDGTGLITCAGTITVDVLQPELPFDIVFVLDRSGSMDEPSGSAVGNRWDALAEGVRTFLPFLEASAPPGSQFGLTLFAGSVLSDPLGTMIPIDSNLFTTVNPALTQTPNGATAMGSGLQDAMTKMSDATRPRVIVLFTDGEQNRNPRVALDGCGFTNPDSDINPPDCPATSGFKIITTGIGSIAPYYLATLGDLASNNRGANMITNNGSDFEGVDGIPGNIGATFAATIGAALSDNSPQQVALYTGPMLPDPGAPGPVVLPGFDVNRQVGKLILSLSFSRRFETPQLVQLLSGITVTRDGNDVTGGFVPTVIGNFSSGATLVADFTNPSNPMTPEGNYVVSLTLPPGFKPDLQYRLTPYVDDHRLDIDSRLSPAIKRVNQPIDIAVQLDWINQGIDNATVVVRAYGSDADMGEVVSGGDPIVPATGEDAASAGVQKYDHLVATDPAFLAQLKLSPNAVTMTHQGNGLYTGSYPVPDKVGVVHFLYNVAVDTPQLGKIQRQWYESAYTRFDEVDMAGSNPSFTALGNGQIQLGFTPVRPSGKRIGPGNLSAFQFSGLNVSDSVDNQDGSYRFILSGGDANTAVEVTLLGDTIYNGPADWGTGSSGPGNGQGPIGLPWWLFLLILVAIILLGVIIIRRRTSSP